MAGDDDILVEEQDEELDEDEETIEDEVEFEADSDDDEYTEDDDEDGEAATDEEEAPVALDVLEAEELEIVESDATDTMLVDEASEIRAIRREEMTLDIDAGAQQSDEFVCQSCFLVLKASQLANKRKKLCVDCA